MAHDVNDLPDAPAEGGTIRNVLLRKIWHGEDPYAGFPEDTYQQDTQGWGSAHPYLAAGVEALRPSVIVEVGVWKGASTLNMASCLRERGIDGVVIAVDTWLGGWDHWLKRRWFRDLSMQWGLPQLMRTFMHNVLCASLQTHVLPLPLDSNNAAIVLRAHRVAIDMIHIDAAHDYRAVLNDLEIWWPLLRPGGLLIGDDYDWKDVRAATGAFFSRHGILQVEHSDNKYRVTKPIDPA